MKIGSLYLVKDYFWLLFPTKETAARSPYTDSDAPIGVGYWSRVLNCEVTYFSPDSIIVFLEEDGEYKKFLTSDGRIGWTWFGENYNDSFEEMKA